MNISDVARKAGVSKSTVSKVMNHYKGVSEETKQKVLAAVEGSTYTPNVFAKSLTTGKSNLIGLFMSDDLLESFITHIYWSEVVSGIREALVKEKYHVLMFAASPDEDFLKHATEYRVDGVIMLGDYPQPAIVQSLLDSGVPCIVFDRNLAGRRTGYVSSDDEGGAIMAVRHLLEEGRTKIAHISGPGWSYESAKRLETYKHTLAEAGLPVLPEYILEGEYSVDSGIAEGHRLLSLQNPPDAVFCAADTIAAGVIQAAKERQVKVPEQLMVVGYDDLPLCEYVNPTLTSIRQERRWMGKIAAEAVLEMIANPDSEPADHRTQVTLIPRGSTGKP
ncbi:LacI family DNA-binding transcriptional regulator [Cohnella candidum]|uniref:LacI family DNA-binding transcriptional regulator n=1 Tax=Cohnella candidum TaxID=2674991 RepID=UPI0013DDD3F2|nr:LacI family DNA-binding transcriptional regulator [Cohnella candidum]